MISMCLKYQNQRPQLRTETTACREHFCSSGFAIFFMWFCCTVPRDTYNSDAET